MRKEIERKKDKKTTEEKTMKIFIHRGEKKSSMRVGEPDMFSQNNISYLLNLGNCFQPLKSFQSIGEKASASQPESSFISIKDSQDSRRGCP